MSGTKHATSERSLRARNLVGCDVVELSHDETDKAPRFLRRQARLQILRLVDDQSVKIVKSTIALMKADMEPSALVKWPGGKGSEAKILLPLIPNFEGRFIDPFVGGGSIYFALQPKVAIINDLSSELINLYDYVKRDNREFFGALQELNNLRTLLSELDLDALFPLLDTIAEHSGKQSSKPEELQTRIAAWVKENGRGIKKLTYQQLAPDILGLLVEQNLRRKLLRLKSLKTSSAAWRIKDVPVNVKTAIHSSFYMYLRYLYNNASALKLPRSTAIAIFYYLREFCYSSMFRFNKNGEFNVPYGGMAYNKKNFRSKIQNLLNARQYLANARLFNLDFEDFINRSRPTSKDFLFLDPPYDSDFSTYDGNEFGSSDHRRLANILRKTSASYLLVIKKTDFVVNLYGSIHGTKISVFDKTYAVSFQNRNAKNAQHLIFVNYKTKEGQLQMFPG